MKHAAWVVVSLAGLAIAGACLVSGWLGSGGPLALAADGPAAKPKGPPPLKVDRSAPLLLDDAPPKKPADAPSGPRADNQACFVCHTNYQEEELAKQHADANEGCVKCHGESIAHRNDENNTTPPDVMYPAEAIDTACVKCHETHDAPARKVLARWQERCPAKQDPAQIVCTDCHGQHRLKLRTVRWDKKTGKLLSAETPAPKAPAPDAAK